MKNLRKGSGPYPLKVKGQTKRMCRQCKHFDIVLMKDEPDSIYFSFCSHPKLNSERVVSFSGESRTPEWCPYIPQTV